MDYICLRRSFKLENTLNVSPKLWEQIKEIENPKAPTFEEFYNAVNKKVKSEFKDAMKNIAEENVNLIAAEYRGHLQSFNGGEIDRGQFLTYAVSSTVNCLYMM